MDKQTILNAVVSQPSMIRAAKSSGLSYVTFRKWAKHYGIFEPNQGGLGIKRAVGRRYSDGSGRVAPLLDILDGKHPEYHTTDLKRRMIKEGLIENKCQKCGQGDVWNGEPLTLQLHHMNGNRKDHQKSNLQILCPNCHSQTSTFAGRRKGESCLKEISIPRG